MAVVSIAIVVSFHLKSEPSHLELRMARPLGIIFWLLSLSCLALGFGNYIKTVNKYSRRAAIVQTGWKTQSVCCAFGHLSVGGRLDTKERDGGVVDGLGGDMLTVGVADTHHNCDVHRGRLRTISGDEFEEILRRTILISKT
jgi:hypothetical protein